MQTEEVLAFLCPSCSQIRPLEEAYKFGAFFSSYLNESDFYAKPSVLLLGQYSTGAVLQEATSIVSAPKLQTYHRICSTVNRRIHLRLMCSSSRSVFLSVRVS